MEPRRTPSPDALRAAARLPSDVAAAALESPASNCGPDRPERRAALHDRDAVAASVLFLASSPSPNVAASDVLATVGDRAHESAGRIGPRRPESSDSPIMCRGRTPGLPPQGVALHCGKSVWSRRRGTRGGGRRGLPRSVHKLLRLSMAGVPSAGRTRSPRCDAILTMKEDALGGFHA